MNPEAEDLSNCLICMGGEKTEVITSVRETLPFALECNIDYFTSVMRELSRLLPGFDNYTFVFTRDVGELPEKFAGTPLLVPIVMGDEWGRIPAYAESVHAIFKAPGQHIKIATHTGWPRFNAMALLQYLRVQVKRYPNYWNQKKNIFAIPYGYYRLPKTDDIRPIMERSIDASFTGSLDHRSNGSLLRRVAKTNKVLSRERLVRIVDQWKQGKPYTIDVKLSKSFPKATDEPEFNDYPQILMDTKICLCPRGTHLETYRLCEGSYYGCVLIAEEQPDHWFAATSPAIILKDWRKLPALLDELLADPARLNALQQASLDYWDSTLAPTNIAGYMSKQLSALQAKSANDDPATAQDAEESPVRKAA